MGRFILFVVAGFVSVVVLTLLVALWMPRTWDVSVTDVSMGRPDEIWRTVSDLRTWTDWSIWSDRHDPTVEVQFADLDPDGRPQRFVWNGEAAGRGELVIQERAADRLIYALHFPEAAMAVTGEILVRPAHLDDARTIVTWRVHGDVGANPFARLSVDLIRKVVDAETRQNVSGLLVYLDDSVAPAAV